MIWVIAGDLPAVRVYDRPHAGQLLAELGTDVGPGTISATCVVTLTALPWPLNARGHHGVLAALKSKCFESGMVPYGQLFIHSTNIFCVLGGYVLSQFSSNSKPEIQGE